MTTSSRTSTAGPAAPAAGPGRRPGLGAFGRIAAIGVVAGSIALGTGHSGPPGRPPVPELDLIATHALSVSEPSDLAIDESGTTLWTVGNTPPRVYQLDLNGRVVKTLNFIGEDLEGVAYDRSDHTLWVAEENRREVVHLDLNGDVLSRHRLDLTGEKNSGLEGICLDDQGHLFALNEKSPGLFLELDGGRSISTRRAMDFAKDFSGMAYDRKKGCFWIVSDKSQGLYLWSRRAGVVRRYALPYAKAEGVAVDDAAGRVYIVSDSENKLYVYRLPS